MKKNVLLQRPAVTLGLFVFVYFIDFFLKDSSPLSLVFASNQSPRNHKSEVWQTPHRDSDYPTSCNTIFYWSFEPETEDPLSEKKQQKKHLFLERGLWIWDKQED